MCDNRLVVDENLREVTAFLFAPPPGERCPPFEVGKGWDSQLIGPNPERLRRGAPSPQPFSRAGGRTAVYSSGLGSVQNKKWRPIIPVAPSLAPWLAGTAHGETGRYVTYRGKPIASILASFREVREKAKLDARVTPYSIRHTLAREMRKARVPGEQISLFLGHLPQGVDATTAIYAPYEPDYLSDAVAVIDEVMRQVGVPDKLPLIVGGGGKASGKAMRGGIGEEKRSEVRRLILSGVPHRLIREQTGVSDGTISAIRKALRKSAPILRASR